MKSRHLFLCVLAGLACAFAPAAFAENEAWYFPDGMLYVPHVNLQDNQGHTVTNYSAFFKKYGAGWNFKLYGLSGVAAATGGVGTNYVTITNYTTISNFVTITTTNDGTNVFVTTNIVVSTNVVAVTNFPSAPTSVAGTWSFTFNEDFYYNYNGTQFNGATNSSPPPFPETITLTLTQNGNDVAGTGTFNSVRYSLSGEVTGDFFAFSMLAGSATSTINLVAGRVLVADDRMEGDYFWSSAGTQVKIGDFTATKQ